ncbi:MAG: hypothetical protein Q9209_004434 [Squamulea sp. 1 TL-2023]
MRREPLSNIELEKWADINDVQRNGVLIGTAEDYRGKAIFASLQSESLNEDKALITVPQHLVLSLENVWIYAKSDTQLREVLEAVGDFSRTSRGAILIFLLLQVANNSVPGRNKVSVSSPWMQYVNVLIPENKLPTFWTEEERALATGTSLEAALDAKLRSLDREFTHLSQSTAPIPWWNAALPDLSFDDWKAVDSMYRSRALDLPGTGHAMVPYIDMANHASGDETVALYDTDPDGNAVLILRKGKSLKDGDEVTITYGDDKGACEMLFSYGFIEDRMTSARELFLGLDIPEDDPLRLAKKSISRSAPGFKLFESEGSISWEGEFVWLICVNEEDGLDFRILQTIHGERELKVFWKDNEISQKSNFQDLLKGEHLWEVFHLRAIATLQGRVEQQLSGLEKSKRSILSMDAVNTVGPTYNNIMKLRELEEKLLLQAYEDFEKKVSVSGKVFGCDADHMEQKNELLASQVVQNYLAFSNGVQELPVEDDFT